MNYSFEDLIKQHKSAFKPLFDPALTDANTIYMELSSGATGSESLSDAEQDAAIFWRIDDAGALAGVGGYLENRSVYRNTELFRDDAERSIHIGVDVFMPAGTAIFAPLDGVVHSFANRQVQGDYGPVMILRHRLDGFTFHSLYGHLSEGSLAHLHDGRPVAAGEKIAEIGSRTINGNWAPHLHFQLIQDMQDYHGDYPGVVRPDDLDFFRANCPDPTSLLLT
ncbi:MAG: peptidoglycan DD-metalloendopeptidase family protein [Gammaproteobacteria bacterium]|nr:peptidoglycan DD-metalloendopeptidase family protein [Gammaproteobacteria bacterium]